MLNIFLTNRINFDKILDAGRDADFLCLTKPQSRFEIPNRISVSNRNVAFLLDGIMNDRDMFGRFQKGHKILGRHKFQQGHIPWNKLPIIKINCAGCKKEFIVPRPQAKYCSRLCFLKFSGIGFKKGHKIGINPSEETKQKRIKNGAWYIESKETKQKRIMAMRRHFEKFGFKKRGSPSLETRKKISLSHIGDKSHFWKGGISFEPYPLGWTKTHKEQIRYRDGYKCQICGVPEIETGRRLDIHHKDYNKKNIKEDNLISLCKKCHPKTNINRNYWKEQFLNVKKKNL